MRRAAFPDLTTFDYWNLLLRKLPRGLLWAQQQILSGETYLDGLPVPLTRFSRGLMGCADILARIHNRLTQIVREARPGHSTDAGTLADWMEALGLPEFGYTPTTEADRQGTAAGKFAATGGASAAYFEGLATGYGVASPDVYDGPRTFRWTAKFPSDATRFCAGSSAGEALVEFTTTGSRAAHAFNAYKGEHTAIFYDGAIAP